MRRDETPPPADLPTIGFTPELVAVLCRASGLTREQVEARAAEQQDALAAAWRAYHDAHPAATLRDFALHQMEEEMIGLAALVGERRTGRPVPRAAAERVGRGLLERAGRDGVLPPSVVETRRQRRERERRETGGAR